MTPLEDKEFAKWWTTDAAKIVWFMIGKWVPENKLANWIYQQTDLFYSLLHEFWSWTVEVWENYNDLFSKEHFENLEKLMGSDQLTEEERNFIDQF
jgi:hypothetical protein